MWMRNAALIAMLATAAAAQLPKYNVGRAPTPEEIKAADISIPPDGSGLPAGSGTAVDGKQVYASRCAKCHGAQAQGGDEVALVGGQGSLKTAKPLKTVGSYWPYATTLWDYVNRSMPFKDPGSLTPSQVYAVTAHILFLHGIVKETDVMDAKTLPQVKMPNRDGFTSDPRPDVGKPKAVKMK